MTRFAFSVGKIGYKLIQLDKGWLCTSTNVRSSHLTPCSSLQLPHLWRGGNSTHLTWSTRMRGCTILEIIYWECCQKKVLWRILVWAELLILVGTVPPQNGTLVFSALGTNEDKKPWPSWPLRIQKLLSSVTSPSLDPEGEHWLPSSFLAYRFSLRSDPCLCCLCFTESLLRCLISAL